MPRMNDIQHMPPLLGSFRPTTTALWCVGGHEKSSEICKPGGLQDEVEMVGLGGLQE